MKKTSVKGKPAVRKAAAKKPAAKKPPVAKKPAAKKPATTYTPQQIQSTGWAPFRYPPE